MKKITQQLFFFLTCYAVISAKAQEEFIEPLSKPITTIPFIQLNGGVIIVKARLDDFSDSLNFIIDTGSSGISLDSTTVANLGLKPIPTERTIRGIAGIRKVSFLYNRKLHFPGLTVDSLDFHVNDYSLLMAVYGEQIDGVIGYSVLSRYIVILNYDSSRITFCTTGTIRYPRHGHLLKPTINRLAVQPMRIRDGRPVNSRFIFDIGAGLCMLLSKQFVEDSNFFHKKRKRWVKIGEGLGGKIDMELTIMKEARIGPYRFKNVPILVFEDEYNITSYPQTGGLIGNDLLRRFNVILNYPKGDIFISPNSHYRDPFDYSYSGLELYHIEGKIIIGDVVKGSPAHKAGLQEGDEVLAVNKNLTQNLNQYKIALQTPNEKVKLIIRRNGLVYEVEFKVKSILH